MAGFYLIFLFLCLFPIYHRGGRFQRSEWLVLMRQRQPGNLFYIGNHYLHGKLLFTWEIIIYMGNYYMRQ